MGRKTRVLAKKRLDKYYRLAKDEGYQSRAAFKLIQLNREYNFLSSCKCLIDLCAAPGGWTQVAAKYMPLSSHIIAVDIAKMKRIAGCVTIQADITTQKCKFEIKKHLHSHEVDAIIHDGAPNVTGTWSKDAYAQCELTLNALKLATQIPLKAGGIFITKVFRSADYNSLLWVFQQLFENVTSFKPIASRSSSAEIYLICQNYLAPKKIDSRLLDSKFVFREIEEKKEKISVMQQKKNKKKVRNRSGYDNDLNGLLYKTANIQKFISCEHPEVILGEYNAFVFDLNDNNKMDEIMFNDKATTKEIEHLFSDLQLLAKSDFRRLLKWRQQMIKKYILTDDNDEKMEENDGEKTLTRQELEDLEDEKLEADVREIFDAKKREKRKQKRKIRQEKIKRTRTMLMGGFKPDDTWNIGEEEQSGQGLFSLRDFDNAQELAAFADSKCKILLPNKVKRRKIISFSEKYADSDEELEVEEARLNALYARYKKNHGLKTKKESRQSIKNDIGLESDSDFYSDSDDDSDDDDFEQELNTNLENIQKAKAMNVDVDNEEGGGLVVEEKEFVIKEDSKMTKAKRWFSDNIFDEIEEDIDENEQNDAINDIPTNEQSEEHIRTVDDGESESEKQDDNGKKAALKYKDLPDILKLPYKVRRKMEKMNRDHRRRLKREEVKRKERDCLFEEVPIALNEDSTDSEAIAEVQAIGAKMLKKKSRMQMIDDSYNKYAFDDEGVALPDWFKDDEAGNYLVNLPVTKEEVREYKARLKAINARPIKKVAEAKARKKLKAQRIWNKIKRQATSIADNVDLSEKTKIKQIEKLYGKKLGRKKNKRVYMVSGGGRAARPSDKKVPKGATKVYVDKRLKADKLGTKHNMGRKLKGKIVKSSSRRQRNSKNKRRKRK